jgi:hypothetical protein
VVVCPGGGYAKLAMDHEGRQVAEWLNSLGVAAFVLKYRLGPRYRHPAPLEDAKRALRLVRSRASEFRIAPDRIGVWGFSAGGHLASTLATHFDAGNPAAADPIERVSCRPDFAILAYPVISFASEYAHKGSRRNLLGDNPDPALVENLSNEKQVTAQTPPTFLFHTNEDQLAFRRKTACCFIWRCGGRACRRSCTFTSAAVTAWAWRRTTRYSRRGRSGWPTGCACGGCWGADDRRAPRRAPVAGGTVEAEAGPRAAPALPSVRQEAVGISQPLPRSRCFALAKPTCDSVRRVRPAAGQGGRRRLLGQRALGCGLPMSRAGAGRVRRDSGLAVDGAVTPAGS